MPVLTNVKPRITQPGSPPGSPTPCDECGTKTAKHMIEICVVTTKEEDGYATATKKDLCGTCLVGNDVAVRRTDNDQWHFGEVKDYDDVQLHPFLMSFLDGDEEWAEVTRTPTTDYLNYIGIYNQSPQLLPSSSPPNILAEGSIGSFSSTSFSSLDETNVGDTFPLFDDSKLIYHLDDYDSLSSLDEIVFSDSDDEEGNIEVHVKNDRVFAETPPRPTTDRIKTGFAMVTMTPTKKKPKPRTPVMWTPDEDENLQKVVDAFIESGKALKWPNVAVSFV